MNAYKVPSKEDGNKSQNTLPLNQFSLAGKSGELKDKAVSPDPLLGELALKGQATVWYGRPNSGKTLIALSLILGAVESGSIEPSQIYYCNLDDSSDGLAIKAELFDEWGINMLAQGYEKLTLTKLLECLNAMADDPAIDLSGHLFVFDTLKKLVDLMHKKQASDFANLVRRLVGKGATVLALAHTNKHPGADGKQIPAGTSDIIDDLDCAFVIGADDKDGSRHVSFSCVKRRGNVADKAVYTFDSTADISYQERLVSVTPGRVDLQAEYEVGGPSDDDLYVSIENAIIYGTNPSKMSIVKQVAKSPLGVSERQVLYALEAGTGERWTFDRKAHGRMVYRVLEADPTPDG